MKAKLKLLLLTLFPAALFSQIGFGPIAGLNLARLNHVELGDGASLKMRMGPSFGGFASIGISDVFAFRPELLYSSKGYIYTTTFSFLGVNTTQEENGAMNYIDVPLLAEFKFGPGRIHVGPYAGFLLSGKWVVTETTGSNSETSTSTETEGLNKLDFGVAAGGGIQTGAGFYAGIRYYYGFAKPFDSGDATDESKETHSVINVSAGWMFGDTGDSGGRGRKGGSYKGGKKKRRR